jgi:hypothetical protein
MLNVYLLSVCHMSLSLPSVIMLSVIVLTVMAPFLDFSAAGKEREKKNFYCRDIQ